MTRETKTIETPSNQKVEIYTYITGGEHRQISNVFLEGMTFEVGEDGKPKSNAIHADLTSKAQDKTIELLVVSVNGEKEGVLEKVLNLPKVDFDSVVGELDKVQNGLGEEKKTN